MEIIIAEGTYKRMMDIVGKGKEINHNHDYRNYSLWDIMENLLKDGDVFLGGERDGESEELIEIPTAVGSDGDAGTDRNSASGV